MFKSHTDILERLYVKYWAQKEVVINFLGGPFCYLQFPKRMPLLDLLSWIFLFFCVCFVDLSVSGVEEKQQGIQMPLYLRKSGWPVNSLFVIIETTVSKVLSKAEGKVLPCTCNLLQSTELIFENNEMQLISWVIPVVYIYSNPKIRIRNLTVTEMFLASQGNIGA